MIWPSSRQYTRSLMPMISGMSCSITSTDALELAADVDDDGPERLGLALREAGGGLVEAEHPRVEREQAGELDDAARAGRQIGDVRVGVAAEAEEVDEVVGVGAPRPFHADRPRAGRARRRAGRCGAGASSASSTVSRTVSSGNSVAAWNVRPRPRRARADGDSDDTRSPRMLDVAACSGT